MILASKEKINELKELENEYFKSLKMNVNETARCKLRGELVKGFLKTPDMVNEAIDKLTVKIAELNSKEKEDNNKKTTGETQNNNNNNNNKMEKLFKSNKELNQLINNKEITEDELANYLISDIKNIAENEHIQCYIFDRYEIYLDLRENKEFIEKAFDLLEEKLAKKGYTKHRIVDGMHEYSRF